MPATVVEVKVPSAGESVTEVQVAAWNAAEGDTVERDQVIVELETDKATSEVTAPATGRLQKIVAAEGDTVEVGDTLALIEEGAGGDGGSHGDGSGGGGRNGRAGTRAGRRVRGRLGHRPENPQPDRLAPAGRDHRGPPPGGADALFALGGPRGGRAGDARRRPAAGRK